MTSHLGGLHVQLEYTESRFVSLISYYCHKFLGKAMVNDSNKNGILVAFW